MRDEPLAGEVLAEKYRVERVLGRGAMGIVVAAEDLERGKNVALKLMRPDRSKSLDAVARFMREAKSAAQLKSEHVVRVWEVGLLDSGQPYMVMERLEGSDLRGELDRRGRLPLEEAAEYLLQALEALARAHAAGIVHRDLKPGNLFVTRGADGAPVLKVLDFGISKAIGGARVPTDPQTHTSTLLGSPLYMSPEQMKASKNLDGRSDLWSVGVILYELLTGSPPFQGDSLPEVCALIVLESEAPRARDQVPSLPAAIDAVIAGCLTRDLSARFASAAAVAQALAPFAPARARRTLESILALSPGSRHRASSIGGGTGTKLALAVVAATLLVLAITTVLLR
jgi:serine/threonine protein kinase